MNMSKVTLYRNGTTIITRFTTTKEAEEEIKIILKDNAELCPKLIYRGTEYKGVDQNFTLRQEVYIYQYYTLYTEMFLIEKLIDTNFKEKI
jgi:hypothetical protein